MDAGKVKVVPNALWDALRAARSTAVLPGAAVDEVPAFAGRGGGDIPGSGQAPARRDRQVSADAALAPRTAALDARTAALGARMDALTARAGALATRPGALATRPDALATRPDAHGARPDALGVRTDALGARADALGARTDALAARPSVLVNLSTGAIAASKDPQLLARVLHAASPRLPSLDAPSASRNEHPEDGQKAAARPPGTEAHTETRSERPAAAHVNVPGEMIDQAVADPLSATTPQVIPSSTRSAAVPTAASEPAPRIETQPAPFFASAAVLARTALLEEQGAGTPPSPLRPLEELIAPFLLRQEPRAGRAPYLNRLILGGAALGVVLLLVL